jgi:predicted permease
VALPSLLFVKIATAEFAGAAAMRITAVVLLATLTGIAVSYVAARLLRIPRKSAGAFIQGCGRANNAFIGLPVVIYSLAEAHPEIEAVATLSLAPAIIFYNIFSVVVLLSYSGAKRSGKEALTVFAAQLFTNPLLLACLFGILIQMAGWTLPVFLDRSFSAIGQAALPLALLSVGASINFAQLKGAAIHSSVAAAIKVFIFPLAGWLIAWKWPGITAPERTASLIFLACPTAVASYVLADVFGSDKEMAGRIIVISTLLSAVSLSIVIALGGA